MVDQVIQNTFLETYRDDFTDSAGFQSQIILTLLN